MAGGWGNRTWSAIGHRTLGFVAMSMSAEGSEELDGVIAAPDHHRVVFENSEVRVVETVVAAGDTTPVHTHPKSVTYVVSGSHFVRRGDSGQVMVDTREEDVGFFPSAVRWSDGTSPHSIENPSDEDLIVIAVELKR